MAMPSRSNRNTSGAVMIPHSSGLVGPGTYTPSRFTAKDPNFAAFASSDARELNHNTSTSADTPGPGAYVRSTDVSRKSASSNVFKNSTPRLSPPHLGSTLLCSSIVDNPGPGQYSAITIRSSSHPRQLRHKGKSAPVHTDFGPAMLRFNPPTIPRKEQSYGYQTTHLGGTMPLPAPQEVTPVCWSQAVGVMFSSTRYLVDLVQTL